jgi:hypothetical protein
MTATTSGRNGSNSNVHGVSDDEVLLVAELAAPYQRNTCGDCAPGNDLMSGLKYERINGSLGQL